MQLNTADILSVAGWPVGYCCRGTAFGPHGWFRGCAWNDENRLPLDLKHAQGGFACAFGEFVVPGVGMSFLSVLRKWVDAAAARRS